MIVYTYYNPEPTAPREQARFIRLWSESWRKQGWTPLLLTQRMAEEHPAYQKDSTMTAHAVLAVQHYNKPGIIVAANMINFRLEPKRIAKGGTMFYPGCVAISQETIRETAKTRCVRTTLDYRYDIFTADSGRPYAAVRIFADWDADRVLAAMQRWP